jgi:hypothetical protein
VTAAYTWDDLARVIELAARDGHHIPGTDYEWKHDYIPLTHSAAASHFRGKVPEGWSAPSGGKAEPPARTGTDRAASKIKAAGSGRPDAWIRTKGTGGIGMSSAQAAAIAAEMNKGHDIPGGSLGDSVDAAIGDWANGYVQEDDFPDQNGQRNMARLMMVVANAGTDTPMLHRGLSADTRDSFDNERVKVIQKIAAMQAGDTLKAGKPASWSDDEIVARGFAGTVQWADGTKRIPAKVGVMLKIQQGSHALSIGRHVPRIYQKQKEWVAPPNAYEVISNDPHPEIPGMRVLTVREVPS